MGGLLGRAVGGMLRSAVGALGEQMRQAQEQVADVQVGGGLGGCEAGAAGTAGSAQESYAAIVQLADFLARSLALAWLLLPHIAAMLVISYAQTLASPCPVCPQDRATRIIETNSRLRDALGGSVRAQPPVSQSSMSQSINGRISKTVTLIRPVVGSRGMAQVRRWGGLDARPRLADPLLGCFELPHQ